MKIENILWDFDGVILDSQKIRNQGFELIFKDYPSIYVEKLLDFHNKNGGLSRYVKIRYFFEKLLNKPVSEITIQNYADRFSVLMKKKLTDKKKLINEAIFFIKKNHKKYNFHIVSGSDQIELRFLCKKLDIEKYFKSIHGSPTDKITLVEELIAKHNYTTNNGINTKVRNSKNL